MTTEPITSDLANMQAAAQRTGAATGQGVSPAALTAMQAQTGEQLGQAIPQAELGLQQQILAGKETGLGGLASTEAQLAAARQGVAGLQTGLEAGVAGGARDVAGLQAQTQLARAAGQAGLYNTTTNEVTAQGQQIIQMLGLQGASKAEQLNALVQISRNPSMFSQIVSGIGTLAGGAAGIMGALPAG
jgi:hypothetical protein